MNKLINTLRLSGCRVFVCHNRIVKKRWVIVSPGVKMLQKTVIPKGGKTIVEIEMDDRYFVGEAICSKSDCYNKKRGLAIALGRAIKKMSIVFEEINLE
jgi:hypothetical protein